MGSQNQKSPRARRGGSPSLDGGEYSTISNIKQTYNPQLFRYLARHVGGLKPSGNSQRYLIGYCPACQRNRAAEIAKKKRPKMWVDTKLYLVGCFRPGCTFNQQNQDVINVYAFIEGLDNQHAVAELVLRRNMGRPL